LILSEMKIKTSVLSFRNSLAGFLFFILVGFSSFTSSDAQFYRLTIRIAGEGSVSREPNQILYWRNSLVTISAIPAEYWSFTEWTGDAAGPGNPLVVLMDRNKTITANFTVNPPSAKLSGTTSICSGGSATLELELAGAGPWKVVYTDGDAQFELQSISNSTHTFEVSPGSTKTYSLISVEDRFGHAGSVSGNATITVYPIPQGGEVSGENSEILLGQSTGRLTLSGYTGTVIRWERSLDGGSWIRIAHNEAIYSETPGSAGTYRYRAVVESGICGTANSSHYEIVVSDLPGRLVLLEHFTNATDQESLEANKTVYDITGSLNFGIAYISYHTSFPNADPINNQNVADPAARALYYGIANVPLSVMDGGLNGDGIFDHSTTTFNEKDLVQRAHVDPGFSIDITLVQTGNQLNVGIELSSLVNINDYELTLHVAVLETEVTSSQAGLQGNEVYRNVVRKLLPDAGGTLLPANWAANQLQSYSLDWTINNVYNTENISVVAFVQDEKSREIFQAGASPELGIPTAADLPDLLTGQQKMVLFPNPAADYIHVKFIDNLIGEHILEVFNQSGQTVLSVILKEGDSSYEVETVTLPGGVYIFRVRNKKEILGTDRVVIMK
jgi:hypothetical protein